MHDYVLTNIGWRSSVVGAYIQTIFWYELCLLMWFFVKKCHIFFTIIITITICAIYIYIQKHDYITFTGVLNRKPYIVLSFIELGLDPSSIRSSLE